MRNDLTEKIKSTLRIEDIIGQTVTLRRTGRGWSGLCPFHDDKTPSFHVYPDSQSYYCFACHESGDIFTFVMKTKNLTFPETVSLLAEEAGINPKSYGISDGQRNGKSVYDVLNMAQEYFTYCLKRLPAGRAYLETRGITAENSGTFGLGYAPDSWNDLINNLAKRGVDEKTMLSAGLVVQGERGIYDRFRGRVMFPVRDLAGRIVAFGGRAILPDVGAKYINSPESETYKKRSNLYMLNTAGSYIREKGYSILCEGYMDTLRLHMAGFRETVASLGTSLTAEQAGLLKRFADRCYICYDGDQAGQKAALRGMYILAENGLDVRVITLPDGKDPDDFLRQNPPESFVNCLNNALPLIPYHIEMLRPELEDELRRKTALRELWDGVKRIGADEALRYLGSLSGIMMLPPDEVRRRILGSNGGKVSQSKQKAQQSATIDNGLECAFCAMLMKYSECRISVKAGEIRGLLTDDEAVSVAECILSDGPEVSDTWRTIGETSKIGIIARGEIFLSEMKGLNEREKWERICEGLEALKAERRIREILSKMSTNTATNDEIMELSNLKRKLPGLRI